MEKKQLLIVSKNLEFIKELEKRVSVLYEVTTEKSIHVAYNVALNLLPDFIFFDKTSYTKTSDFKNLKNFKSTHFLTRTFLMVYAKKEEIPILRKKYKNIIDDLIPETININSVAEKINEGSFKNTLNFNYWHECFMGMFNLMAKPIVLLQQNTIIAMNDAFKNTFKFDKSEGIKLTDLVNVDNKAKVKSSLRNFARGKHMKAVTNTSLLIQNEKLRNAKISFSKLSRNIPDQFIMIIDFEDEKSSIHQNIGSHADQVTKCFEENSELAEFSFTKREKEIISLLCKGYKTKEISETLFISPKTIEKHRSSIIKRTNSETILESVVYAINHNLLDLPIS